MAQYPIDMNGRVPFVLFTAYKYDGTEAKVDASVIKTTPLGRAVTLYIPEGFGENVGATWGSEAVFDIHNAAESAIKNVSNAASSKMPVVTSSVKAQTGQATGPTDLLMFQKPNPFQLTFNYNFVPRNAEEGAAVIEIIKTFKELVLPTGQGGFLSQGFLIFPAIWNINFSNIQGPGNPAKGKFYENMALTSCNIGYSSGANSILVFHDGVPVQCSMSLSFTSIEYAVMP